MIDPTDTTASEPAIDDSLLQYSFGDPAAHTPSFPAPEPLPDTVDDGFDLDEPLEEPDTVEVDPASEADEVTLEEDVNDGVYGNADEWVSDWFYQGAWGYCGPTSVAIIINEFMDASITDPEQLADRAVELGLVDDISNGMYMSDLHTLLEDAGVPAEHRAGSMDELQEMLGDGYGIIASVDSGEIWGDPSDAAVEDGIPDHALVVTEIDTENGTVTVADPGLPHGNNYEIPIEVFEDAWEDSGFDMIATEQPDQDLVGAGDAPVAAGGAAGFALINLSGPGRIQ